MANKFFGLFGGKKEKSSKDTVSEEKQKKNISKKNKEEKTEQEAVEAHFEIIGRNENGYVFVSKTGEKGVALLEPNGSIHFVSCDPDKIDELEENERNIFTAKLFFVEVSPENMVQVDLKKVETEPVQEEKEILQEQISSATESVDINDEDSPLKRVTLVEDDMNYQGIDDTVIAQLSGRGIPRVKALVAIEIVSNLVKNFEISDIEPKMESMYCDLLVSNLAVNLYMLNKPEEYSRFIDVFLDGKREITGDDCLRLASFSRAMPVLSEYLSVIKTNPQVSVAKINRNFLDSCKDALLAYVPEGTIAQRPVGRFESFNIVMDEKISEFSNMVSSFPEQAQPQNF